jgi:hypothetical protein
MLRILAILAGFLVAGNAQAQSWPAGLFLIREGSRAWCQDMPLVTWDLKIQDGVFSGSNNYGAQFSSPVFPDGSVKASYTAKIGDRAFAMELTGNVHAKLFVLYNAEYECRFKMVPK